ncbi:hypothetical protein F5X68DRAFT_255032 [Plectosphaerella plurivora]|uniref:Alternative oxidase n=1 Tax=Plectosphaerella plurivora TaxID=936078 RepID=A0A9P8VEH4_9PEZI|nr:hypothetical protein F5X68DRAFT_255032 [Plectosphaerella plurivora]
MLTIKSSAIAHALKIGVPVFFIVWTLVYFGLARARYDEVVRGLSSPKTIFINDFLGNEIDGKFEGRGIAKLCKSKIWTPGLVMSCDPAPGGVGEVRNANLNCIRIAIEVGAELILPEILRRSDTDITDVIPDVGGPQRGMPASHFFDLDNLNHVLSTYCPQMKVYQSIDDLYNVPSIMDPKTFTVHSFTSEFKNGTVLRDPNALGKQFHDWLNRESPPEKRRYPMRVHMEATLYTFPIDTDEPDVMRNFGRMLHVRPDARRLAAAALYALSTRYRFDMDPRISHTSSAVDKSFFGVHLRIERDVDEDGHFQDYATQAATYLKHMGRSKAKVAYVASGADDAKSGAGGGGEGSGAYQDILDFTRRAAGAGLTVVTKRNLLDGGEQAELRRLTWDQRALVDYEVLLRAGEVLGTGASSFAWSLAVRRAHAFGHGDAGILDPGRSIVWQDEFSTLYGKHFPTEGGAMALTVWP